MRKPHTFSDPKASIEIWRFGNKPPGSDTSPMERKTMTSAIVLGIPLRNTAGEPVPTSDEAKACAEAYVHEKLTENRLA